MGTQKAVDFTNRESRSVIPFNNAYHFCLGHNKTATMEISISSCKKTKSTKLLFHKKLILNPFQSSSVACKKGKETLKQIAKTLLDLEKLENLHSNYYSSQKKT